MTAVLLLDALTSFPFKVKAKNSLCGSSRRLRYAIEDGSDASRHFNIDSTTGTICLEKKLDFEMNHNHQFTITAVDQTGSAGTCLVSIQVQDANDNVPIFNPISYNITIREGYRPVGPLLVVSATDEDEGTFGEIRFLLKADDTRRIVVDESSGEVFLKEPLPRGKHDITIQAKDGSGSTSEEPAHVHIYVVDSDANAPEFTQSSYVIKTPEDILPGISIGSVLATGPGIIRYSIYSGDVDHQFMIHPDTGRITVSRYLDADKHDRVVLNVQAELLGGATNQTQVVILIQDHNDNSPQFPIDMLEITVSENQSLHDPFYVVCATDKDKKKNGAILYSLISSDPPCPVMVQPLTGQLQLNEPLDFESVKDYRIRIKAQDQGIPPRSANMTLIIHVNDFNDNPPIFENATYEAEVAENSPLMTTVLQVRARDADSRENGKVLYRITNGSSAFGIDEKTGIIYTKENIDREMQNLYSMTVTAQDQGEPPLSSSILVRVIVTDVNDNAPSCASATSMVVPMDSALLSAVGTVVVADPDNGANGTVVYRIQQPHPLFIVKGNGDVQLRRLLRESDPGDIRLSIIASDQGLPQKSTVCHVQIKIGRGASTMKLIEPFERHVRLPEDCRTSCQLQQLNATGVRKWQIQSNDVSNHFAITKGKLYMTSRPQLPSPWPLSLILSDHEGRQKHVSLRILEPNSVEPPEPVRLSPRLPIGSKVASVASESTSKDVTIYYSLKNESAFFELDETNGDMYLIQKIRNLAGQQISVYFWEIDGQVFEKEERRIDFEVGHGTVDPPHFGEEVRHVSVPETTVVGTVITTVNASSSDPSAPPTYSFLERSNRFAIDQYSGDVTVIENLHWKESPYHLVVVASVAGSKAKVLLLVHVEDVNDNHPEILSSSEVMVFAESNRVIHHVVAVDDDYDKNGTVAFEVVSDPSNCFSIDRKTGALSMLRHPSSAYSTIVIRASDHGSPALFMDQTLTIRLHSGAEKIKYFSEDELEVEITDATPAGTVIKTLNSDGKAAIRLFPTSSIFVLDELGRITLLTPLTSGDYDLSVLARGINGDIDLLSLVVRVTTSKPTGPRMSSASCGSITIPENRVLQNFKQIVALNTSRSSMFNIRGSNKFFNIDPETGKLSSIALDRERHSEHLLVIGVYDGEKTDSCSVQITVSDVNDNIPQFSPSTPQVININDTMEIRDLVYRFAAFDEDVGSGGSVLFELVEDSSNAFDLIPESGELLLMREPLDVRREWMIRVRVYDQGHPSLGMDRLLTIQNSRTTTEKPEIVPTFLRQKYVAAIDEGLTPGQIVSKVATSSRDSRITYSIVEGNTDNAFEIDDDGVVRTAQELDYEIKERYDLKIIATGAFPHQIRTRMLIDVHNVNDNPPVFRPQTKRKVLETLPLGSYITTVTANDADNLAALEYSLDPKEERFVIDRFTGVVHLATTLDYETVKEINVVVMVSDGNFTVSTSIVVVVMDVNDNAPKFQQRFVNIKIPHSIGPDDVILKLTAIDRDSGENGRVSYSLADNYGTFHLDSSDGTLSVISPLSSGSEFLLTVTASDNGFPMMSSTIPVIISITKKDSQWRPEFSQTSYEFVVSESIARHIAFGNVSVDHTPYFYRIMDPTASEVFDIDRLGRFSVKGALDRETHELYSFTIDVGSQSMAYHENSTATVTIRVSDVNDNYPSFNDERKPIVINDGLRSGDVLRRLRAVDADAGDNGRVSYRIVSGDDYNIFIVESNGGALIFSQWDDEQLVRHVDGKWMLYVEARDHGTTPRASLLALPIVVELESWSGSAPFFVLPSYQVVVPENASRDRPVFTARATNRFGISMNTIRYQLKDNDQMFSIHSNDGSIRLRRGLDFESRTTYKMSLIASDANGRSAVVSLEFIVLPVDEFPPVFTKFSYTFQVPLKATPGAVVGEVCAVDADGSVHGIPEYRIEPPSDLVAVERRSGLISLKSKPERRRNRTIEQITLIAASSHTQQSRVTVYLEIGDFPLGSAYSSFSSNIFRIGAVASAVLMALMVCLLGFCLFGYRSSKPKEINSPHKQIYSVSGGRNVRAGEERILRLARSPIQDLPSNIPQKSVSTTSSALSNSGLRNSLISHREGASTRSQHDSGIDQDALSVNSSVTEYLISNGVNPNLNLARPRVHRHDTIDSAINDYIYARLDNELIPGPPGPVLISENLDKLEGFYHCSQSRVTAPPFQPLTEILDELEEMQRDQDRGREYVQVEI